jgi:NitT/TauT family transport system permease protein
MMESAESIASQEGSASAERAKAAAARRARYERLIVIGQALPVLLILSVWQFGSGRMVDAVLFGTPAAVVERLAQLFRSPQFYGDLNTTLTEIALGYAFGVVTAMIVAFMAWRWKSFDRIVQPYIIAFNAIPKVALAPVFLIWFGIGIWSKVATAFVLVFFLAFYSVYLGLQALDLELVDLARIMGCNERQISLDVLLPATLPFVLSGLRTSMPYAIIGVIIGEFAASTKGIGYRVLYSAGTFDPAGVYAHIVVLVVLVLAINSLLGLLEAHLIRWRPHREQAGAF